MMNRNKILVAASIAGLMASSSVAMAGSAFPGQDSMNKTCRAMNGCPGVASCKGQASDKGSSNAAAKMNHGKLTG